jgi:hypothetical protein
MKKGTKHTGPSGVFLREMPGMDLKDGRWRPNPFAARIAAEGINLAETRKAEEGRRDRPFGQPARAFPRLESGRPSNPSQRRRE